jgi:hypothetical protein
VTVALVNEAVLHDHALVARVLDAPELAASLREWAEGEAA